MKQCNLKQYLGHHVGYHVRATKNQKPDVLVETNRYTFLNTFYQLKT